MKKIEDLFFTVTKILSTARNFEQLYFFYHLLENEMWYRYDILLTVEQLTFLKKVSSSRDSSRCISSSWPWLLLEAFFIVHDSRKERLGYNPYQKSKANYVAETGKYREKTEKFVLLHILGGNSGEKFIYEMFVPQMGPQSYETII